MKCFQLFAFAINIGLLMGLTVSTATAQVPHSDVEFGYDSLTNPTAFIIEQDNVTSDNIQYFESAFEELDPFSAGNFSADEPGFTTAADEGLLIGANHRVFLNFLNASTNSAFGVGYVNYFNPATNMLEASGSLAVLDNSTSTADLILNGAFLQSGVNPQFLGLSDAGGDLHDHLVIDLLNDGTAPLGAYGVLAQLQSDFNGDGTFELSSDPFWMIFNHGMDESDFDNIALPQFGVTAIPEPGSMAVLIAIGCVAGLRRRRR